MKRLKILTILNDHLLPITNGYNLRIFNLLSRLVDEFDIDVICYAYQDIKCTEMLNIFKSVTTCKKDVKSKESSNYKKLQCFNVLWPSQKIAPSSYSLFDEALDNIIKHKVKENKYDAILSFGANNHIFYLSQYKVDNIICDVIDSSSLLLHSLIKKTSTGSKGWALAWAKFIYNIAWEKKYLNNCKGLITISDLDRQWQRRSVNSQKIYVIGNGVDLDYFSPKFVNPGTDKNLIVFTGVMDYEPNYDAMIYCIQEIWPLILSKNPKARLKIVGRNPKAELVEIGKKANNVEITGEVNDMREALKGARIFICPMRIGAGMKNKIIESLSMGIPVLVNQKAVEGVEFPNGKVGYIVNDIHEIPDLISQLISNDAGWAILSKNARRFCIDHFNWNDKAHQLAETIKLIILS